MRFQKVILFLALLALLTGCYGEEHLAGGGSRTPKTVSETAAPTSTGGANLSATPTVTTTKLAPTPQPSATPFASGPDVYPAGVNPLTGEAVADVGNLELAPALVSVSNFPISARPSAGLSYSPLVIELYIGVGQTRFLTLFYGDLPEDDDSKIGPIRSGRLPYETLRQFYHGFMVISGASSRVLPSLRKYIQVRPEDVQDISSAFITVDELKALGAENRADLKPGDLSGLAFDPNPPPGGKPAQSLWVAYHRLNQIFWRYRQDVGAYHRFQDNIDGKTFAQVVDRLSGEPLAFENVVVMFADYHFFDETFFNIDLTYITRYPALLMRDGRLYEIYWTTRNAEYELSTGRVRPIRFTDSKGNVVALKPGQTWIQLVQLHSPVFETVDSQDYDRLMKTQQPGSGYWAVRFYPPAFELP